MTVGTVLLAGGASRRMGTDKAKLKIDDTDFLTKIASQLGGFDERLLSVAHPGDRDVPDGFEEVPDIYTGRGPIGGLFAALSRCRSDALLAVSCDLPLFDRSFADYLLANADGCDVLIPRTPDERAHPLCAVWQKDCAPVLAAHLRSGDCRLMNAAEQLDVKYISPGDFARCLTNVNTPEDYKALFPKGDA